MGKTRTTAPSTAGETVAVRALTDSEAYGLTAGRLAHIPAAALPGLKSAGMVDDHPDAVAYAESLEQGADEPAAE